MPAALLAILQSLLTVATVTAKDCLTWVKQQALRAARAARSVGVWLVATTGFKVTLVAAVLAACDAALIYIMHSVVSPLAGDVFRKLLPNGTRADGFAYMFWDSGLNVSAFVDALIVYMSVYTALWKTFDTWLRSMCIALSTYRDARKRAEKVLDASIS